MEDITPESKEVVKKQHTAYKIISALFSALVSFFVAGCGFYWASKGIFWFIPIGSYFVLEGLFILFSLIKKNEYKAMRLQGVFQILGVITFMSYLLFMMLWNDPDALMDYSINTYLVLGIAFGVKFIFSIVSSILIKLNYNPLVHAYRNNDLISSFYFVLIAALIVCNYYYPGTSTALFDNLLREKPLWIYIINIALNGTLTMIAALLALSTDIRSKTREQLSTVGKIKHTIKWFNNNEVTMFFGLIFTMYLAILAIVNMRQSPFYIFLFFYYIGTAFIRLNNYVLHKMVVKAAGNNQTKDNRLSSWILLLDAFMYLFFSNVLILGAVFMMIQKVNTGANIYLFLFFIIPMALWRFLTSNRSVRANRKANNTYKLGVSLMGIVSSFFSLLEIVAIAVHNVPIEWVRYVIIIAAIAVVKIAVIVVAVIFIIHWIRSMILNSKRKERRKKAQKQA